MKFTGNMRTVPGLWVVCRTRNSLLTCTDGETQGKKLLSSTFIKRSAPIHRASDAIACFQCAAQTLTSNVKQKSCGTEEERQTAPNRGNRHMTPSRAVRPCKVRASVVRLRKSVQYCPSGGDGVEFDIVQDDERPDAQEHDDGEGGEDGQSDEEDWDWDDDNDEDLVMADDGADEDYYD